MGEIVEALFTCVSSEDNTTCSVQDLRTGTDLMKYKGGGNAQHHSLAMLSSHYVMAANTMKPLLHVWPINGQEQMSGLRFVVPGKVNALALSPDGAFLVVGIQENIYIWHLNTGRMLNTISRHYQAITCLRFNDNGEHFVSAGKDGAVLVWNLTQAVSPLDTGDQEANAPLYSFYDHGLAVTDLYIGLGGLRSFMYTVSLDRCCKLYDLNSGSMLLSVVFPVALHSVIVNRLETMVYVGTSEGTILPFHLQKVPRQKEYHLEEEESQAFAGGHLAGKAISCLALSVNGQQLISGGEDKLVCLWDVTSRQLIKSIAQTGVVTNLRVRLCSPSIFQPENKQPQLFADSLKRMISPADDDDECIQLNIHEVYSKGYCIKPRDFSEPEVGFKATTNGFCHSNGTEAASEDKETTEKANLENGKPSEEEELANSEDEASEEDEEDAEDDEDDDDDDDNDEEEAAEDDDEEIASDEETTEEELDDSLTSNPSKPDDAQLQKLIEENSRLKAEAQRMFEIMFNHIAINPKPQPQPQSTEKRKKARKN
ncbi:uncharacterized protein Dwil_GK16448 [Drosophila willistoni]|uniref:Uncharacterized protein n=1 Tax=Drosophila willistoni TaxID=7260 RepID=B4N279_DROWI|nr:WD repeat-containing protein 18 [Drosophila willistoni]EDW78468.1 uncharacterized protein Dwil_GK16448 [Drosophila willistoni]